MTTARPRPPAGPRLFHLNEPEVAVTMIDEIEELRAELRHSHLTAAERRDAEARLHDLLEGRGAPSREAIDTLAADRRAGRKGSTDI